MTFLKCMRYIRKIEFYFLYFIGCKWSWSFKTIPEFASHDLATNKHLITAHWIGPSGPPAPRRGVHGRPRILKVVGKNINDLYNKICICSSYANCKICN